MSTVLVILTVLIIISAILLTLVVLVQDSKGGGLASSFQSSNQIMGVRRTTDYVEKATWWLAGFMLFASILVVGLQSKERKAVQDTSAIQQQMMDMNNQAKTNTATPNFGENPAQQQQNQQAPAQQQSK